MDNKLCKDCGLTKPIGEFQKHKCRCKICEWKKLNEYQVLDGWTIEQYNTILDSIINIKIKYINELTEMLDKTLDDIVLILKQQLKIGNKPLEILWNCDQCSKEFFIHPCKFVLNENMFCSHKCYGVYKKIHALTGKDNPDYNRVFTNCTNCQKELEVIPWNYNQVNQFGDNHNFCSHECYYAYRSIYYVKDKANMYKCKFTKQQINECRKRTVKFYENGVFDRETKPQKITNHILDELGINYQREKGYKYYCVDNYLIDHNLIIEVMGDYFHSNPNKFKLEKLNKMQKKGVKRDKSKRTYIKKYHQINILYLWEYDLNKYPKLCEKLIQLYISNKGNLENFNSFNYCLDKNNNIKLANKITRPYYELSSKNP